jgi:DNA recombination protein RmuC
MEWIMVVLLISNLALVAYLLLRPQKAKDDSHGMMLLQNQIENLTRSMDVKLGEGNKTMTDSMHAQFTQSQRLVTDIRDAVSRQLIEVAKNVSETKESTKQVFTIADQLQNLERVLKNQKQRGNLGEASLELVLSNILAPGMYESQYQFKNGEKVDAIIRTKEGIIPIDAKFPLENYMRLIEETDDERRDEYRNEFKKDVKKRIDEAAKYIRPDEETLPFAFMYIPAEGIYYDLLTGDARSGINARSMIDYAYNEKRIIIVSPTTFAAYLQSVLYGFKAFKIEKDAEGIKKNVEMLMRHIEAYDQYYKKLGVSLSTTVNHYNAGSKELGKIDKDVLKITGASVGLEALVIDKPALSDGE